jgi:hypothetical protein
MSDPDEHKLSRDIGRQARAQALMRDELLQEGFAQLEARYIAAWRETGVLDTVARERLWQAIQVLGKVRDHLGKIVADGRLAQREIDQLAEKRKRFGIV